MIKRQNFLIPCLLNMALWYSGYHNFIQLRLNSGSAQVKHCLHCVGDSREWGSLTMVPAGNKAKCLLSVNRTTKANYHHHHHHHHHWNSYVVSDQTIFHANKKLDNTVVNTKDIPKILSKLNCNKTHDHDNISLVLSKKSMKWKMMPKR